MKTTSAAPALARFGLAIVACILAGSLTAQTDPSLFTAVDVGAVGAAGSTSVSNGVFTVRGAGEDVFGPYDEFHYYHRSWTGDAVLIARVTGVEFTFNWAKAGLMIRSGLTSNAQHAYALVSPERNTSLVYRAATGGNTTAPSPISELQKAMPVWLRLIRAGDNVAMDFSEDGRQWFRRSQTTIGFPATVQVGLAVNSHVDATLCTATFDNFSVDTVRPTRLEGLARSPARVYLRWQDSDLDETGFEIERSTDNVTFARIATAPAWNTPTWNIDDGLYETNRPPPSFEDNTVAPSTTYYYRVRSITARGNSPYSNTTLVATPPPPPPGWSYQDIGDTSVGGRSSLSGSTFTVSGAGAGVGGVRFDHESQFRGDLSWHVAGYSDEFQFCSKPWSGDGEMVARVSGLSGAGTGHAGLMVRVDMNPSALNAFSYVTVGGGVGMTARPGTSGFSYDLLRTVAVASASAPPPPTWLKIVRADGGVMSFASTDGMNWTELGWITTPLAADVRFGMGVSSQNDGAPPALPGLLTATFDNVTVGPVSTPLPPPAPPTDVHSFQVLQDFISIAWTKASPSYDGTEVQTSTDGVNFTPWGTTSGELATFSSLRAETDYYFRLRTRRGTAASPWTTVLRVRTQTYAAAPTNVAATALSQQEIRVTWTDNATNENGFFLEQSTDGVNFVWVASPVANATSHTVGDLSAATTYYYRLIAYPYDPNNRVYSNVASATTPGFGPLPNAPSNLVATAASPNRVDLTWTDNSPDETGFTVLRSTDNQNFAFLLNVGANITSASDASVNGSTTYYYRAYAVNTNGGSLISNTAVVTTPATPPTGESWQAADIGGVAAAGSSSESGGVVTLRASGADIWNTADEFHYRFQPWSGDGTITVRVTGLTDTNGWAKAGVMFRESLAATARHAMMIVSIAHGTAFQYRAATGGESSSSPPTGAGGLPRFLRLVRAGNTFTGYESSDGVSWTQAGTVTLPGMPTGIFVGLVATSHNDGVVTAATFDTISVGGPAAPGALPAPSGLTAVATTSTQIELAWNDHSADETGFTVQRSADGTNFADLVTVGANIRGTISTGLAPATTYWYRVYARRGDTVSGFSNVASATTPAATPPADGWQSLDIGTATAGTTSVAGSSVTLAGSGRDIWNTADGFRYHFRSTTASDSDLIVRVAGLTDTHGWAKAGVMFRESLAADSPFTMMIVSVAHGTAYQYRTEPAAECSSTVPSEDGSAPRWLRIARRGITFYGYTSSDGVGWTQVMAHSSSRYTSTGPLYVGLVVTSHNEGVLCTAAFDNVTFTEGLPSATPPNPPANLTATVASAVQVNLAWTDASGDETGFEIERSTDGSSFTRITTTTADATSYSDHGLSAATTYYYRARAVNGAGPSAYTAMVTATTPSAPPPSSDTWTASDIGSVAAGGSSSVSGSTATVRGSGADIWNNADEFHYRYTPWSGDGEIITRVTTLSDTHGWAKAGVMFRENLSPNSRHAFMCVSIAHGTAFQYRAAAGGESGSAPPSESGGVPRWLRLVRSGNTFTGYASADGASWTQAGSLTLEMPPGIYVGQAVTSHNDGVLCTATFENMALIASGSPPPPPPSGGTWSFGDVGAVGIAGSNTSEGNTITVHASGADIWDTADGFRFVYRTMSGDGAVEAQVSQLEPTHAWAKAGVMIRESLAANAKNVFAFLTPVNGVAAQQRAASGGTTTIAAGPWWVSAPYWVRLVRTGSRITAFSASDGINWSQFAVYDVDMGATVYVGFAVTSHDDSQLATAVFVDPSVQ